MPRDTGFSTPCISPRAFAEDQKDSNARQRRGRLGTPAQIDSEMCNRNSASGSTRLALGGMIPPFYPYPQSPQYIGHTTGYAETPYFGACQQRPFVSSLHSNNSPPGSLTDYVPPLFDVVQPQTPPKLVKGYGVDSMVLKQPLPTLEGWLMKRGPRHGMVWRLRFCTLKDRTLTYYAREDPKTKKGEINLDSRTRIRAFSDRTCSQEGRTLASTHPMGFEIFRGHNERCYLFDAWTHEKLMVWMHGLILHWSKFRESPSLAYRQTPPQHEQLASFAETTGSTELEEDDDAASAFVYSGWQASTPVCRDESGALREFPSGWGLEHLSSLHDMPPDDDAIPPKRSFFRSLAKSVRLG